MSHAPVDRPAAGWPISVVLLVTTLVTACATGGQEPSAVPPPTANPTPVATATPTPEPTATPTPEPTATPTPNPGPFSGSVTVSLDDLKFLLPTGTQTMTVTAGTTVIFQNDEIYNHTVTHGQGGIPADPPLFDFRVEVGTSASLIFDEVGTYTITCKPHPGMNMTVVVI